MQVVRPYTFLPTMPALIRLAGKSCRKMLADKCFTQAAAISYYFIVSIFPLLLLMLVIAGFFLEPGESQREVLSWLSQYFPAGTRMVFRENMDSIIKAKHSLGFFSIAGLLWAGSLMFDAVNEAVNKAWGTQDKIRFFRARLDSIILVALLSCLVFISALMTAQLTLIERYRALLSQFHWGTWVWQVSTVLVSFTGWALPLPLTMGAFAAAYRFLPRASVRFGDIWLGAVLAAGMWEFSKRAFVWYVIGNADYGRIYGSITAVFSLLLWSYFSALIFIWGAEFSAGYASLRRHAEEGWTI